MDEVKIPSTERGRAVQICPPTNELKPSLYSYQTGYDKTQPQLLTVTPVEHKGNR